MPESSISPNTAQSASSGTTNPAGTTRFSRLVATYYEDHQHPINHFLHVCVGWPMVGSALFLAIFRPWLALGLFFGGYAFMFSGHFLFERNIPTILKHPSTPFVMAASVTRHIFGMLTGLVRKREIGTDPKSSS